MSNAQDEVIINELKKVIHSNKKVTSFVNQEARKMLKIPYGVSREKEVRKLEDEVDKILHVDDDSLHKLADVYVRHGIAMRDSKVERLTTNNYCIDAKKRVIDDLLCSVL